MSIRLDPGFWQGRRVFLTGHTGFKGAWLALWLHRLGAHVTAFSLPPATEPSLFFQARIAEGIDSEYGDIRNLDLLTRALHRSAPSIVLHLAAQAIVAEGYRDPLGTFSTNLMGTLNLLAAMRDCKSIEAAVLVTSDKCYVPPDDSRALAESDPLGGNDPYSASKACAEIAVHAWRASYVGGGPSIATVRAGNVIGGGDWSQHRLVPDLVRAFVADKPAALRMPDAIRPWQHVLDALGGYLQLAQCMSGREGGDLSGAWNFGPDPSDATRVGDLAQRVAAMWGPNAQLVTVANFQSETGCLRLDSSRARTLLGWRPKWSLTQGLVRTIDWYKAWVHGEDLRSTSLAQLDEFMATA